AEKRREVTPTEQHAHSFLEVLPIMATSMAILLHWRELQRARLTSGRAWAIHAKREPLSRRYRAGLLGVIAATLAVPYGEELLRCLRAAAKRKAVQRSVPPRPRAAVPAPPLDDASATPPPRHWTALAPL